MSLHKYQLYLYEQTAKDLNVGQQMLGITMTLCHWLWNPVLGTNFLHKDLLTSIYPQC